MHTYMHTYTHTQVRDLVDVNGVRQGKPGYLNEFVQVNDILIAIDGTLCEHMVSMTFVTQYYHSVSA